MTAINILGLIKDLISDNEKMEKFKEIVTDVKELISDIKDVLKLVKG